jgi:hypothetical protein
MTIYSINPQSNIDPNDILNIMTQLTNDISESIKSIYNIIIESQYNLMIQNICQILNDYLKIYYFYDVGVRNIYVQIYNQNINLVAYVYIKILPFKYIDTLSLWYSFYNNIYYYSQKYIYNELDNQQKNELRYSIIENKLYFIDNISFTYDNLMTNGILFKSNNTNNNDCKCMENTEFLRTCKNFTKSNNCYITTIYWN